MTNAVKVRFSRDGDYFHYLWAARRCLKLLIPNHNLVAVAIEGASRTEDAQDAPGSWEEVVDVAEYYGSEKLSEAQKVSYIQLKHSTRQSDKPWTLSGIAQTIKAFADRYKELLDSPGTTDLASRVEFQFVSNRPIAATLAELLTNLKSSSNKSLPKEAQEFRRLTGLDANKFKGFCNCLTLQGRELNYQLLRTALSLDTQDFLPDNDVDAPIRLKELVHTKALSESLNDSVITKNDVLRALRVSNEEELFPARSRLESLENSIQRSQEDEIVSQIKLAAVPVLVHAPGGVGKSVLAQRIQSSFDNESICIVYDSFGNGDYRRRSQTRHRHKDGLVQIANELSGNALCYPLIPSPHSDESAYMKAFLSRLRESANSVRSKNEKALICIVVDAADNAEMEAELLNASPSFPKDLLKEPLVEGTRLVVFCRTERIHYLDPPSRVQKLELSPFEWDESAKHLRRTFPQASDHAVDQFHRLTGGNPRIQANAISQYRTLSEVLASLGPTIRTIDTAIEAQLEHALASVKESIDQKSRSKIDVLCRALAVLRPLVPISVLSILSGLPESAVTSFATDFGRPLLINEGTLQFRDEPVETWFRNKFMANDQELEGFIQILRPLAQHNAYVASSVPYLLLEAKKIDELVALAIGRGDLPTENPAEKREIELQRFQLALKAALRAKKYVDAARLAFLAGRETAGNSRQRKLQQQNTDLVADFMPGSVYDIVYGRIFGGDWLGSQHAYEAGLLSYLPQFRGEAASRLRMAYDWLANWSSLPDEERQREGVKIADIAEMAIAEFNLRGADGTVDHLNHWQSRTSFTAGRLIARRFIDHGRFEALDSLALHANAHPRLILAIALELHAIHRFTPEDAAQRAFKFLSKNTKRVDQFDFNLESEYLLAITAVMQTARHFRLASDADLANILGQHLPQQPPRGLVSHHDDRRFAYMSAYALQAALLGTKLDLRSIAHPELRTKMEGSYAEQHSDEVNEFESCIGSLLPWHQLRIQCLLSATQIADVGKLLQEARDQSLGRAASSRRHAIDAYNEIARLWFDILTTASTSDKFLEDFNQWLATLTQPIFTPTWHYLARLAANTTGHAAAARGFCNRAIDLVTNGSTDCESIAETYIECCRAIFSIDYPEASEYFAEAIAVVSKLGDEVLPRWEAMLDLADQAADPSCPSPEFAYRLARCAEVANEYLYDYFDEKRTISSISGLSPSDAFAALSRWRDRGFASVDDTLESALAMSLKRQSLNPSVACSLIPLVGTSPVPALLRLCFQQLTSRAQKEELFNYALEYVLKEEHGVRFWGELIAVAKLHSLDTSRIDQFHEFAAQHNSVVRESAPDNTTEPPTDWKEIFHGLQSHTTTGIVAAYERFSNSRIYDHAQFWKQLLQEIKGNEVAFLKAVAGVPELHLFNYRYILEQIPEAWKQRKSVSRAVSKLIVDVCSRFAIEITNSKRYAPFPLDLALQWSLPVHDPIETVLSSIGRKSEALDSSRLFTLIGVLALKLSSNEALEALSFAVALFEEEVPEQHGDGSWRPESQAPTNLEEAVAGFVWATLAAPEASLHWRAAHAVVGLVKLGAASSLKHLMDLIQTDSGGCFVDSSFPFYSYNARLYLLVALARAVSDSPALLAPYFETFTKFALTARHVLICHFAAKAAEGVRSSGLVNCSQQVADQLLKVNTSKWPVGTKTSHRKAIKTSKTSKKRKRHEERFHLAYDFDNYWIPSIANCFDLSVSEFEQLAEAIIVDEWQIGLHGRWDEDPRRKLYREREAFHSYSSHPSTEPLTFYLSFHALMTVAGDLLASVPVVRENYDAANPFEHWLQSYLLTRQDGRWLADRVDPPPLEWRSWKDRSPDEHWRWTVDTKDFDQVLKSSPSLLNLWGRWTIRAGSKVETIAIHSALVSNQRSNSLLRALQTTGNHYLYRIPTAGEENELDVQPYQLKGWVKDEQISAELDEYDPWSKNIEYPPLAPADFVLGHVELEADSELRYWRAPDKKGGEILICSEIWGAWSKRESELDHGRRLRASPEFLSNFLSKTKMDLIIEVSIGRKIRREHYETRNEKEIEDVEPYIRFYLLRANGKLDTLSDCTSTGHKVGRRPRTR